MQRKIFKDSELTQALDTLTGWRVEDKLLKKHLKFENFAAALSFVNQVGALAEAADHHPDIKFGWGYAEIETTTHDREGVTQFDITLAKEIDALN